MSDKPKGPGIVRGLFDSLGSSAFDDDIRFKNRLLGLELHFPQLDPFSMSQPGGAGNGRPYKGH